MFINQVIRGTREILVDSSGLSSIMKGVRDCVVGYEFTRFTLTIITASYFLVEKKVKLWVYNFSTYKGIAKVARAAVSKKKEVDL